jgi:iron(III) transport system ATP-binding protein
VTAPHAIRAVGVEKRFGDTAAVSGAGVTVEAGQLTALLGPSGSGKTTLLRVIAGFEVPDAGTVEIGGQLVAGPGAWVEPEHRRIGMVFQDGALFPHLTVSGNVEFGGPRPGRAEECLSLVGLAGRGRSYPHELSGGERQRVALARALAVEPAVVLLDEPFAALDATLRVALREEVAAILRRAGASALLVTHDQQEALSLADQVVLMRDGRVEQAGSPEEVYARPATRWVAGFLGAAEVVSGTARDGRADTELGSVVLDAPAVGPVDVLLRPEAVAVVAAHEAGEGAGGGVPGRVLSRSFFGHDQLLAVELESGLHLRSRVVGSGSWRTGDEVLVRVVGPVHALPRTDER